MEIMWLPSFEIPFKKSYNFRNYINNILRLNIGPNNHFVIAPSNSDHIRAINPFRDSAQKIEHLQKIWNNI